MEFGDRLVKAREKKGLNQKELAQLLGITPTRLNYWEKNKREPDVFMIKKLAFELNVSTDYLIGNNISKDCVSESFNSEEQKVIKKYRALDEHGKMLVDNVLDLEYKRVTSHKSNEVTINIAARGGENELTLSEEKYQKLLQVIEENKDKEIPDIGSPRTCGENFFDSFYIRHFNGSPPHLRGKPFLFLLHQRSARITPAPAGKTKRCFFQESNHKDHPRTCGENFAKVTSVIGGAGSPPHLRGKHRLRLQLHDTHRITPAPAGKTTLQFFLCFCCSGSPPHLRGKHVVNRDF